MSSLEHQILTAEVVYSGIGTPAKVAQSSRKVDVS